MGRMDGLMQIVAVMEHMKWTHEEYLDQPAWVVALLKEKMIRDHKAQERALKK